MDANGQLAVVIMAESDGSALKSRRAKVLHEVGGRSLLRHVIAAASQVVAAGDIYVVIGCQADKVRTAVAATGVNFVEQTEGRGAGHAIQCALEAIKGYESFLVLPGDVPLIRPEDIAQAVGFHQAEQAAMTVVSVEPEDPAEDGREVSVGMYAFRTATLMSHLSKLTAVSPGGDLCLSDVAHVLHDAGERVVDFKTSERAELMGVNTLAELAALDTKVRAATASRLMAAGVTIFKPETCLIDAEVEVAPDTVIEPYVQLRGSTRIGAECLIRSYTVIENCSLGNDVLVRQSCILNDSKVADGARIGPFAHVRPGCEIGEDVHIGNFVETKKARLNKGVKAGHLTYLGDAEIGERTNIGAGTITCNYDGVQKHKTRIGKDAFIGSDSTLVAPVTLEDGAYIGAGSCITKNVPAGALAVGRAHQTTKEGWVAARRARQEAQK